MAKVALLAIPLALLWLASLAGAWEAGRLQAAQAAAPPEPTYAACESVVVSSATLERLNQLQAAGNRITHDDPVGVTRLLTLCK